MILGKRKNIDSLCNRNPKDHRTGEDLATLPP
jgi:hypothetical protein